MQSVRLFFVVISVFLLQNANAQFEVVAKSAPFSRLVDPTVVSLKNGNTVLVHYSNKKINLVVYDSNYELSDKHSIASKNEFDFNRSSMYGKPLSAFEVAGNVVLLYYTYNPRQLTPYLYRTVINPEDGEVISDNQIGEIKKGRISEGAFTIKKDDKSDNYAIAYADPMNKDKTKRLEIAHYNSQHEEISRAFIHSPAPKFNYAWFMDMEVIGNKEVIFSVLESNSTGYSIMATTANRRPEGALLLGRLKA